MLDEKGRQHQSNFLKDEPYPENHKNLAIL